MGLLHVHATFTTASGHLHLHGMRWDGHGVFHDNWTPDPFTELPRQLSRCCHGLFMASHTVVGSADVYTKN